MLIRNRRGWELPERLASPEALVADRKETGRKEVARRDLLVGAGSLVAARSIVGAAAGLGAASLGEIGLIGRARAAELSAADKYPPGRPITAEADSTTYNNYYEFSPDKDLWRAAQALPMHPWSISFAGMVEKPRTMAIEDLLKQVQLEDRVYRHRCVEAWSMVVPWTGFPMSRLVALAAPLSSAKYVVFETLADRKTMPGLRQVWYPWPYIDSVTMAEATNDLAFIPTGMYGKPLPPQNGGPIRIHLPWKYGFKSVKSIIKVTFTDQRPVGYWEKLQNTEYGFWANVNPAVPHPRWSQASERVLGSDERIPTEIYNGYGAFVAAMYADMPKERLFM
jgi:sulfoxide reductase catalytic subunit YedY